MSTIQDGPRSPYFQPLAFKGHTNLGMLAAELESDRFGLSDEILAALDRAPGGSCVCWGIPFEIDEALILCDHPVSVEVSPARVRWLVFLHTLDVSPAMKYPAGLISPAPRSGPLGGHAADYVISYADGSEARAAIRRRHQIGTFTRFWGETCFEAVAQHKPYPVRGAQEQLAPGWGRTQTRVSAADNGPWVNWLWAWQHPHLEKSIVGFRFEPTACGPAASAIVLSAITAGNVASLPLRRQTRHKACLDLPEGDAFEPDLDQNGLLKQIQLDLGQVISATPRLLYPNKDWPATYNNQLPALSKSEILLEYTAHPEACFHLFGPSGNQVIPVSGVEEVGIEGPIQTVATAQQRVMLRVVERGGSKPVPVKLHIHGEWDEYLAPVDRHRILNPHWFEDYGVDHLHVQHWDDRPRAHACTYIPGETQVRLPLGKVYVEVPKGFEIRPVRKVVHGEHH